MVKVQKKQMHNIAPLFRGSDKTMVLSCLQGHMGDAWADAHVHPTCARIITGDMCIFAGYAANPIAVELIKNMAQHPKPYILMLPPDPAWGKLIESAYPGQFTLLDRFAFTHTMKGFNEDKLRFFTIKKPREYEICLFSNDLYNQALSQKWSQDFFGNFQNFEDFQARGHGYAVVLDGTLVGGASSYNIYDGGIEVEIDIHPEHRRKGLATACAATLILHCLERGLYPSWDAANLESSLLAQKLGYLPAGPYPAYAVALRPDEVEDLSVLGAVNNEARGTQPANTSFEPEDSVVGVEEDQGDVEG